ncbi:DEKNAAC102213 [Brettanomyces naardenensis]|uniref:DEKNAAC102213 n=1 Tax=Brettanomyces naardenensis TaxID=13370 RepID=A0A448YLP2_BRENA|nr:DEKNAAC102213 [Brettanomyces naardenensis]
MPRIATDNLTVNNLGIFNKITAPKEYSEKFIKECQESGDLCQYGYFEEVPVGVVVSKSFVPKNAKSPLGLAVVVLRVLEAYSKKFGLEDALLEYIEKLAVEKKHLHRVFLVLDKTDEWLIGHFKERGYEEGDVEGLEEGSEEGKVVLKRDLAN